MPLSIDLPTDKVNYGPSHTAGHNTTNAAVNTIADAFDAHEADTTSVHGITDTSVLETTTGSAAKITTHAAAELAEGANTTRLLNRLTADLDDVSILIIGDSTGNEATEWPRLTAATLAARYPAYTVIYHLWDITGGVAYDTGAAGAATTVQTGTGSHTLHIWCCATSGQTTAYVLGSRWTAAVVTPAPDLVLISLGHNEGTTASGVTAVTWRTRMLMLTEAIAAQHPLAAICLVLQNPRGDGVTDQQARARTYRELAALCGYGIIDAQSAFLAVTGYASTHVGGDFIHPTTTGSTLWADEVARHLVWSRDARARTQPPSGFTTLGRNLLLNGRFDSFGSSVPDSWTATAATTAKDTRTGWFESATGWGVRIQASSAAQSYISQDVAAGLLPLLRGRRVTVAARLKVPSGQTATAGRVQISDNVANHSSTGSADLRDGWYWAVASLVVDAAATLVRVRLYADTASSASADVTVDSIHLVLGALPRVAA
jgi:hypothetical protein